MQVQEHLSRSEMPVRRLGALSSRDQFHNQRIGAIGLVGDSQVAGVVISVLAWNRATVLVRFRGEIFGKNDLYDNDFVLAGRQCRFAVLVLKFEAAVAGDPPGVSFTRIERAKLDTARLNRLPIIESHGTAGRWS